MHINATFASEMWAQSGPSKLFESLLPAESNLWNEHEQNNNICHMLDLHISPARTGSKSAHRIASYTCHVAVWPNKAAEWSMTRDRKWTRLQCISSSWINFCFIILPYFTSVWLCLSGCFDCWCCRWLWESDKADEAANCAGETLRCSDSGRIRTWFRCWKIYATLMSPLKIHVLIPVTIRYLERHLRIWKPKSLTLQRLVT